MPNKKKVLPLHSKNDGAIAQLVEQRTENPCVPSSILGGTTKRLFDIIQYSLFFYKLSYNFQPYSNRDIIANTKIYT